MSDSYRVCLIGCGRMGATIDDEIVGRKAHEMWLPYSHAAAVEACDRTVLVGTSDVDAGKSEAARERYGAEKAFTDYCEMIREMKPDIVCIATRPSTHAEMTVFAAENGVRGIYCEKSLCSSMEEADSMRAACNRAGVAFNYGAQRRYMPVYRKMREMADSGELGEVKTVVGCHVGESAAQWGHTHTTDTLQYLAGDPEVDFVQGTANVDPADFDDDRIDDDPGIASAAIKFANGMWGYITARPASEFEISGTNGTLQTINDVDGMHLKVIGEGKDRHTSQVPFPEISRDSGTLNAMREIVAELDGGSRTSGNIDVACRSQEIIFAIMESERNNGARVRMPLEHRTLFVGRPEY